MAVAGGGEECYDPTWHTFLSAVQREDIKEVRKLIKRPSIFQRNLVEVAVNMGKNKVLSAILQSGHNVNKSSGPFLNTPMHIAVLTNNLPAIKMLLHHGADMEKFNAYNSMGIPNF